MNPLAIATKGKGLKNALRRGQVITQRYGMTSHKMDQTLERFVCLLQTYQASATFPITAVALQRNSTAIRQFVERGLEFAIHGFTHIDHSQLSADQQAAYLNRAMAAFGQSQTPFNGFRCPYLRWNEGTLIALRQHGLLYDSSQGLAWDALDGLETPAYRHVLNFYGAQPAQRYPALPRFEQGLLRIPYCLPDDEGLIDRLQLPPAARTQVWLKMLQQIYELGELFTVGLHPERFDLLAEPLAATLAQARTLAPAVWIARLDEIAAWWCNRTETNVTLTALPGQEEVQVAVAGPVGLTILARRLIVNGPTAPWSGAYERVLVENFTLTTSLRPVIGLSPRSAPSLHEFLRQQGYVIELNEDSRPYPLYLDRLDFAPEDERPLLAQIENGDWPLLRLGRWPDGARAALNVTGDIDALTLWDYGLRFLGS
ncbi:MAG: polysaccharide deacetylase family protein [Anaerolineales bacterium]|nr:polysaccharide deacetylase family protein [Anaerolineales bacterium]